MYGVCVTRGVGGVVGGVTQTKTSQQSRYEGMKSSTDVADSSRERESGRERWRDGERERRRAGGEGRGHGKEYSTVTTYTRLHGNYHTRTSDNAVPPPSPPLFLFRKLFIWSICAVQYVGDEVWRAPPLQMMRVMRAMRAMRTMHREHAAV